jgi:predicted nucleic acid-binding protein
VTRVVVDTSVWSLAFRRSPLAALAPADALRRDSLAEIVLAGDAVLLGVVRQELLTGLRPDGFTVLRDRLRALSDEPVTTADHERAAAFANACRAAGVQGSPIDFLICAVAARLEVPIFTTDRDFDSFAQHLPISLHAV